MELHNPGGEHYVVTRTIRRDGKGGKSTWRLNGRAAKQGEVDDLIKGLHIQTGNLCQFLPQDKVHEFSKMNNRELLGKTIAAVGEEALQADHEK